MAGKWGRWHRQADGQAEIPNQTRRTSSEPALPEIDTSCFVLLISVSAARPQPTASFRAERPLYFSGFQDQSQCSSLNDLNENAYLT